VKVMLELPPQSPEPPVMADRFHEPAPAPVMSCKSTFVHVTVAAVIVLAVPRVLDLINALAETDVPFDVNVPDTV
jgi:hypothetical protein